MIGSGSVGWSIVGSQVRADGDPTSRIPSELIRFEWTSLIE